MYKRIVSFFACILMFLTVFIGSAGSVSADSPTGPIKNNGTNGIYIDIYGYPYSSYAQIPNWGQYAYGNQGCAWFASARACQLTGKSGNIHSGYSWYYTQYANYGYSRGSTVKAKALACYDNHVSVVERVDGNVITISEGGARDSAANSYCRIVTTTVAQLQQYDELRGNFLGYVYLGVAAGNEPLITPDITTDKESYSVGDTVNVSWKASSANSVLSHYWIHINSPSGSNLVSERINNATSYSFTASENGQYYIMVYATPVGSQSGEGSLTAEKYITVAPRAGKPVLSVKAGDSASKTLFTWSATENTVRYVLDVKKTDGTYSQSYEAADGKLSIAEVLSAGDYTAVLSAYSENAVATTSDAVTFTVAPTSDGDGWIYADTLPSNVTSGKYEIQYKYTYEKTASADLGNGWVKGGFNKTQYENSGEPYWSNIELPTSDTRVLLSYYYYHFCSGSRGEEVNYEYTDTFTHYDAISSEGVYETSSGTDFADSRYKFYTLSYNGGGGAYCQSGVTCDGSHGSHGNRSHYWYRTSQYQDRVAVSYYNYSKTGDWTSAQETGYSVVTYRYRAADMSGNILGDANVDGTVNVKDATAIQKHIADLITLSDTGLVLANTDGNSNVNVKDATAIQKHIAGMNTGYPIGKPVA